MKQPFRRSKLIAHCYDTEKNSCRRNIKKGEDVLILIGREGRDFDEQEVQLALANGFVPISLGDSRLRTEAIALVACHHSHVLNQ